MVSILIPRFEDIFEKPKPIIGVVHLKPLPGAPLYEGDMDAIVENALRDAHALEEGGVDGIIVENYNDVPFRKVVKEPETIAAMGIVVKTIVDEISLPVGVSFLRNSAVEALGIAYVTGAKFIRVNVYVDNIETDSGIIEAAAPDVLRYARKLGAKIGILADIHVKHGSPLGSRSLEEVYKDAFHRGLASAVIVTGPRTGEPPNINTLVALQRVKIGPILIGSGLSIENIDLLRYSDGAIVGTFFKKNGITRNPVDKNRVKQFMQKVLEIQRQES